MTTIDLHNQLLQDKLKHGPRNLRQDFEFEDLFEPAPCEYCERTQQYYGPSLTWKFCPACGRKFRKENNNGI